MRSQQEEKTQKGILEICVCIDVLVYVAMLVVERIIFQAKNCTENPKKSEKGMGFTR